MTAAELRAHFIARDDAEVKSLRDSGLSHTLEARLAFVEGRLEDTATALMLVLKMFDDKEIV